ncbi:MAG: sulfite exporter TauE/SafE family protein [Flavobacteriales bacterium]|nr:sulfite exporter TauE/SafE family protein [Flavobacteriales bacterium]
MDLQTLVILLLTGLTAGMLGGFIGVGGGIIVVPAMIYFLGMNQFQAQGTSLAMMLPPIGILAVMNYYKAEAVDMRAAMILAGAFIIGGYLGSRYSLRLDPNKVKLAFGIFMLLVAVRMTWNAWKSLNT